MIAVQICIAYGSMALFIALLNNVFLLYYVDLFVSVYRIDKLSFWVGEVIFLVWNSVNDPLFGWLSDHKSLSPNSCGATSPQVALKRFRVLSKFGPLFALSFLLFWFPWGPPGLQFVLCLCFYDGFLTLVDLNHLALLADLALSAKDRTRLNGYCSMFSVVGCLSVFLSYSVWDKDNIASFRLFCFCLSIFAVVGFTISSLFLRNHLKCEKVKVDTPIEEVGKSMAISVTQPSDNISQELELKEYIKQLINHKNFLWFAVMNLVQVFHCHFNSNFFPLFLEKLLGDTISPRMGAMLLGISFVVPHINNLYFLSLCRKYGVYEVIKWLFYAKLCLGISMMTCGPQWTVLVCIFIASNRVFTEGTCKLLNLVISDLVDEDFVLHGRKQAISALVFGTSALLSKPGQTLAPLIGTWLLASQTGTSIFYTETNEKQTSSFHENTGKDLRWGCFCVLVYIPIVCAVIQIVAWSRFTLHGNRLTWVKHMRKNRGFQSATVY